MIGTEEHRTGRTFAPCSQLIDNDSSTSNWDWSFPLCLKKVAIKLPGLLKSYGSTHI